MSQFQVSDGEKSDWAYSGRLWDSESPWSGVAPFPLTLKVFGPTDAEERGMVLQIYSVNKKVRCFQASRQIA